MHARSFGAALAGAVLGLAIWPAVARAQDAPDAKAQPKADAESAAQPTAQKPKPSGSLALPGLGKLTVGGSIRLRGEYRGPATYDLIGAGVPPDPDLDGSAFFERVRLWANLAINDRVSARVEFQDSRTWGTEGGVTGNLGGFDLFQGYFQVNELFNQPLSLKLGRFSIPRFGDQRIMSDLIWHNYGRVFDGGHAIYGSGVLKVHALAALLTEASAVGAFPNNYADDDHWFTGAVVEYRPEKSAFKGDFYLFGRFSESRTTVSEKGPPNWWRQGTMGAWLVYAMKPFVFTLEGYNQFGRQGNDDIWAYAWAANVKWKVSDLLGVLAEYNYASGDHRPTDGKINTFDPLFPFAHAFNGHIDAVDWKNVHVVKVGTKLALGQLLESCAGWDLHVDGLGFWLANRRDAWYGVAGGSWRADPTRTVAGSAAIGSEVDIYVKGKLADAIGVWAGYSHFFPGVYAHDTGNDHDMNWVFLQLTTKF